MVAQRLKAFYKLSTAELATRGLRLASTEPLSPISSGNGADEPHGHESDDSNVSGSDGSVDAVERVLVKEPLFLPGTPESSGSPQLDIPRSPSTPFHFSDGGRSTPKGMLSYFYYLISLTVSQVHLTSEPALLHHLFHLSKGHAVPGKLAFPSPPPKGTSYQLLHRLFLRIAPLWTFLRGPEDLVPPFNRKQWLPVSLLPLLVALTVLRGRIFVPQSPSLLAQLVPRKLALPSSRWTSPIRAAVLPLQLKLKSSQSRPRLLNPPLP